MTFTTELKMALLPLALSVPPASVTGLKIWTLVFATSPPAPTVSVPPLKPDVVPKPSAATLPISLRPFITTLPVKPMLGVKICRSPPPFLVKVPLPVSQVGFNPLRRSLPATPVPATFSVPPEAPTLIAKPAGGVVVPIVAVKLSVPPLSVIRPLPALLICEAVPPVAVIATVPESISVPPVHAPVPLRINVPVPAAIVSFPVPLVVPARVSVVPAATFTLVLALTRLIGAAIVLFCARF